MPESKAYVSDEWTRDAITIQVAQGDTNSRYSRRVGVVERPTGLENHAPVLRMIPVLDLYDDDAVAPRPNAPHPGITLPVDVAEAVLVALLAWSSSTPGDNPVERAKDAEARVADLEAQVASLEHMLALVEVQADLRVAEAGASQWEVLAVAKDEHLAQLRDHLADVSQYAQRDAGRLERLDMPQHIHLGEPPVSSSGIVGAMDVLDPRDVHLTREGVQVTQDGHCGHPSDDGRSCTRNADHGDAQHHDGTAWWGDDGQPITGPF